MTQFMRKNQRGIALIVVMLLTVAVAALAAAAIFLTSGVTLVSKGHEREEELRNAADAGIELGRSALNGTPSLFPDTGYRALFVNQTVLDANGVAVPGVTRSVYYGPTGSSTGQYGIFGSVVSVIADASGAVVVRRGELAQESFAKFAYYTDSEGSGICFGNGDQIFGPVHTNDDMCIYDTGVRFRSTVEVSGTITGKAYGTFDQGYTERGAIIPLPTTADLTRLNTYATAGGMSYTAPTGGTVGSSQARMRIEFVSLDLDGDGRVTGPDEGFYRIYQDTGVAQPWYVMANRITNANTSENCGHYHGTVFYTANRHRYGASFAPGHNGTAPPSSGAANEALSSTTTGALRCYLGGDEHLFVTTAGLPTPRNTFVAADSFGMWVRYSATPDARVIAGLANAASANGDRVVDTTLANRQILAQYLWPLSRAMNVNSKGVIYVAGKVALNGVLNSKVTVAATDNVTVAGDLKYAIAPGSTPCLAANILGLLSPDSIFIPDNTLNSPWDYTSGASNEPCTGSSCRTYKVTSDETLQGIILSLQSFTVEDYGNGATAAQPCGTTASGRGCLFLTGGIIQQTRGAVGTTSGTGYVKRYAYDVCAYQTPPPYFPTTGRFSRNRYYEIDPVGFNVTTFFASLRPN
jgi:hypothetical protein